MIVEQAQKVTSNINAEMLLLQKTVIRLKKAYPPLQVSKAQVKQMHIRLMNRMEHEGLKSELPFWRQWSDILSARPQMVFVVGFMGILMIFLAVSPLVSIANSSTTATALDSAFGPLAAVGLAAVIVIILWIKRRK